VSVSVNDEGEGSTFDNSSSSTIKLNTGTVLYLREVNKFLALVCILREDNFDKQGLIDYNFQCFRQSIQEVFETAFNKSKSSAHQQSIIYNNSFDSKQSNGFMDD
jgi:Ras-related GTP-binding protein C/D